MNKKILAFLFSLLVLLVLFVVALPAGAGAWATVGVTEMPETIYAERPFTIEFMVWQHGNKPVHELHWGVDRSVAVSPLASFGSPDAGEKLMFTAVPLEKPGLFRADIILPGAGTYYWSIAPEPLHGVTEFDPLTVEPAAAAPTTNQNPAMPLTQSGASLRIPGALALVTVGVLGFLFKRRRTAIGARKISE